MSIDISKNYSDRHMTLEFCIYLQSDSGITTQCCASHLLHQSVGGDGPVHQPAIVKLKCSSLFGTKKLEVPFPQTEEASSLSCLPQTVSSRRFQDCFSVRGLW